VSSCPLVTPRKTMPDFGKLRALETEPSVAATPAKEALRTSIREGSSLPQSCNYIVAVAGLDVRAAKAAKQPEHEANHQHQSKNAAEAGPAIAVMTIIAAASEEKDQHND
jgi:hypothetical protein